MPGGKLIGGQEMVVARNAVVSAAGYLRGARSAWRHLGEGAASNGAKSMAYTYLTHHHR